MYPGVKVTSVCLYAGGAVNIFLAVESKIFLKLLQKWL